MRQCIYCNKEKKENDFSLEHIFPEALGGEYLNDFWKTNDVCRACNNMAGVFVDAAFIKSFFGNIEKGGLIREYLSLTNPNERLLPLNYMGTLSDIPINASNIAEHWIGACGSSIIHIHPKPNEALWNTYAGGDPRPNKKEAGRAYLIICTKSNYWNTINFNSFLKYFKNQKRILVNATIENDHNQLFSQPDLNDPIQKEDMKTINYFVDKANNRQNIRSQITVQVDAELRFLSKVAIGIGYKIWGYNFFSADYSNTLRMCFREAK